MSLVSSLAAVVAASAMPAQSVPSQERPETLARLMVCRGVADNAARLACFDTAAGALDTAQQAGEVIVMDRAQVNQTRHQLFGLEMPALPQLFGPEGAVEIESVETTLKSASLAADGRWTFRLADGSVWRQIDYESVGFRNRPGQPVEVRRAAMGSFMLTVGNSRAVRVRRQSA